MRTLTRLLLVTLAAVASLSGPFDGKASLVGTRVSAQVPQEQGGNVRIGVLKDGAYQIVSVPLEEYVSRVLAGEAAPDTQAAALEALAIAVRTYTATNLGRHASEGFDLCDQTHCQVMRVANDATVKAANATANRILTFRGAPATVYYSASCGGRSEKPSNVWPGADDPPYLSIHDDDACEGFPQWTSELFDADLQRALIGGGFKGTLRDVKVTSRDQSGRVVRLELTGMDPNEITGQDLRMIVGRTFGFQNLQSTMFDVQRRRQVTRFTGHGYGHGVGLCVIGSMKLAAKGQSTASILARYFPGTELGPFPRRSDSSVIAEPPLVLPPSEPVEPNPLPAPTLPPSPEAATSAANTRPASPPSTPGTASRDAVAPVSDLVVVLPASDASERAQLTALVLRERQAMADALAVPVPRVRVRFHETAEQFERAAARPSFQLATLTGDEIQLAPLWMLRERGMLERAVRRSFVHAIVDSVLPERPAWVREGAAVYFADPPAVAPGTSRITCPTDDELQHPVSIGSLGEAWTRARTCFERQVSGGRDWRRVR